MYYTKGLGWIWELHDWLAFEQVLDLSEELAVYFVFPVGDNGAGR